MSKQPSWNTPARIDGLPASNWKKRTGVALSGTVDQCVTRWLDLAGYQKADCTLGWGPNDSGEYGCWSGSAIGSYVRRHGLPPMVIARRGGPLDAKGLARLTAMDRYDPSPGPGDTQPSPARIQTCPKR